MPGSLQVGLFVSLCGLAALAAIAADVGAARRRRAGRGSLPVDDDRVIDRPDQPTAFVTGREMLPVVLWALLVVGLTVLPYLWAIGLTADGKPMAGHQFEGLIWGVDDGNVYLQWIRQAAEGHVLLRNQVHHLPAGTRTSSISSSSGWGVWWR